MRVHFGGFARQNVKAGRVEHVGIVQHGARRDIGRIGPVSGRDGIFHFVRAEARDQVAAFANRGPEFAERGDTGQASAHADDGNVMRRPGLRWLRICRLRRCHGGEVAKSRHQRPKARGLEHQRNIECDAEGGLDPGMGIDQLQRRATGVEKGCRITRIARRQKVVPDRHHQGADICCLRLRVCGGFGLCQQFANPCPVHLARRGQRHIGDNAHPARDLAGVERAFGLAAKCGQPGNFVADRGGRANGGGQAAVTADLDHFDNRIGNTGKAAQHMFNPVKLNPAAAKLDLPVNPAKEPKQAIVAHPTEIAGQVDQPFVSFARIVDETLGGAVGQVVIAKPDTRSGDGDLAGFASPQRGIVRIDDKHVVMMMRRADRQRAFGGHLWRDPGREGRNRGFGRPVDIDQMHVRVSRDDTRGMSGRQHVAADGLIPHRGKGLGVMVDHQVEHAGIDQGRGRLVTGHHRGDIAEGGFFVFQNRQ